jgi:hypothetical protein
MADQVTAEEKANVPNGRTEISSNRTIGQEDKGLLSPTQDDMTDERRAKYGQNQEFNSNGGDQVADSDVNDVKTPNNPTMLEQIRRPFKETSYGMAMCA